MEDYPQGRFRAGRITSAGRVTSGRQQKKEDSLKGRRPYRKIASYKRDIKCRQTERLPLSKIISLQEDDYQMTELLEINHKGKRHYRKMTLD